MLELDVELINWTFLCSLILSVAYYLLAVLLDKCPGIGRIRTPTQFVWSIGFYLASTSCLLLYHQQFVQPDVDKADGRYFPQYENLLFFLSEFNQGSFKNIFAVTLAFHLFGIGLQVHEAQYADAVTRILFTAVLGCFYNLRFEHFFLVLHITIGLYQALTHSLYLIALYTDRAKTLTFNVCALVQFSSWSYIFLVLLPFNYLLPTLYMKPFNAWLNVFCWMWYGSCVWNSPILQVIYHQTFHTLPSDCLGMGSVAQCLLLRETKETRHLKWLRKTVDELKAAQSGRHSSLITIENDAAENQSAKALQTLKCVMTLKRKLKRIREAKAAAVAALNSGGKEETQANGSPLIEGDRAQ